LRVIIFVTNDIETDERLKRSVNSLIDIGIDVLVVGVIRRNSNIDYSPSFKIKRFNLFFDRSFLFYLEFNLRLFFLLLKENSDFLFANDLDTVLGSYLSSLIKRKPMIIDSHEYFTGVPELNGRGIVKSIWKFIERWIYPKIKYHITVSYSIADMFNKEYGIKPVVIRNIPAECFERNDNKHQIVVPFAKYIIYQGALNKDRGLEELIQAMPFVAEDLGLVIAGTGDIDKELIRLVKVLNLENRVFFTGRYSNSNINRITSKALMGVSLEKDSNINYRYCLPNKLFSYIQASIPVIVSNMPEMASFVKDNNLGIVILDSTPKSIATSIKELLNSQELYSMLKSSVNIAKEKYSWNNEKIKLTNFINDSIN